MKIFGKGLFLGDSQMLTDSNTQSKPDRSEILRQLLIALACFGATTGAGAADQCYRTIPIDENMRPLPIKPMCSMVEANLNEFCNSPPPLCEMKVAPKFSKHIVLPKWTPVDLKGSLSLVEATMKAPSGSASIADTFWNEVRSDLETAFQEKRLSV